MHVKVNQIQVCLTDVLVFILKCLGTIHIPLMASEFDGGES